MLSLSKLFHLPNEAVRVLLQQVEIIKQSNSNEYSINQKVIEVFNKRNCFTSMNFEVTLCRISQQKDYFVKIDSSNTIVLKQI